MLQIPIIIASRNSPPKVNSSRNGEIKAAVREFISPVRIAIDSQDHVYVADIGNHRIQKFIKEGKFLNKWGRPGHGNGEFKYPHGIAISRK